MMAGERRTRKLDYDDPLWYPTMFGRAMIAIKFLTEGAEDIPAGLELARELRADDEDHQQWARR